MARKKRRIFSLHEANELIPELQKRLKHLQLQKETYRRLHDALFVHELVCVAERSTGFFEKDDLEENIHALERSIEDLAKDIEAVFGMGCILRDIEKGCVDFPAVLGDKKIYWSWRQDETSIQHYRPFQNGPGERLLIPAHILEASERGS